MDGVPVSRMASAKRGRGTRSRSPSKSRQVPDETIIEEVDKIAKPVGLLQNSSLSVIQKRMQEANLLTICGQLKEHMQNMGDDQVFRIFERTSSERWSQVKQVVDVEWSEMSAKDQRLEQYTTEVALIEELMEAGSQSGTHDGGVEGYRILGVGRPKKKCRCDFFYQILEIANGRS